VGFANVPAPVIGARAADSVGRISRSSEMASFSVRGSYDRPIPRRICEEAGLARGSFATEKAASAPLPTNGRDCFVDALYSVRKRYEGVAPER
jgi:hypothetical protein